MEPEKESTQARKGKYLNWNERILIEGFLKAGMSESNIAKELARDRRTINREGDHFEQAYNAQAAVDTETYPIVGQLVTDAPNDKQQLNPVLESIPAEVAEPENILADTGYYSEDAVQKAEADDGPTVYCAMAKSGHHVSVTDLEKHPPAFPPSLDAPIGTGGPPPQYARGQGALQAAQTYRRTRFWDH